MRTDLLPSILISEFYIQLASSFHMKCTVCRKQHSTWRITILQSSIDCSQTTFSLHTPRLQTVYMHPDYLQSTPLKSTTQPTYKNLSSWRTCRFYRKKPEQHSAQTRTRILPEEVFMLQTSKGTVRVLCI